MAATSDFLDVQWHHMKEIVPPHQGITGSSEEVQTGAAGNQKPEFISKEIVSPFENIPPTGTFVNLIKYNPWVPYAKGPGRGFKKTAVGKISLPCGNLVPVEIEWGRTFLFQPVLGKHRFSNLPWPCHEDHVPACQILVECIILNNPGDIICCFHILILSRYFES